VSITSKLSNRPSPSLSTSVDLTVGNRRTELPLSMPPNTVLIFDMEEKKRDSGAAPLSFVPSRS